MSDGAVCFRHGVVVFVVVPVCAPPGRLLSTQATDSLAPTLCIVMPAVDASPDFAQLVYFLA